MPFTYFNNLWSFISEFTICLIFAIFIAFQSMINSSYIQKESMEEETVEAHSIHVALPRIDQLTKDKTKLNSMNVSHQEMAVNVYKTLTLRQIH